MIRALIVALVLIMAFPALAADKSKSKKASVDPVQTMSKQELTDLRDAELQCAGVTYAGGLRIKRILLDTLAEDQEDDATVGLMGILIESQTELEMSMMIIAKTAERFTTDFGMSKDEQKEFIQEATKAASMHYVAIYETDTDLEFIKHFQSDFKTCLDKQKKLAPNATRS